MEATCFVHQGAVLTIENSNERWEWKECDLYECVCVYECACFY